MGTAAYILSTGSKNANLQKYKPFIEGIEINSLKKKGWGGRENKYIFMEIYTPVDK